MTCSSDMLCMRARPCIVIVSLNTLWRSDNVYRAWKMSSFAIYASNNLTFVLTSLFFHRYKLRHLSGSPEHVRQQYRAHRQTTQIRYGERERYMFRCMRRKTPIVIEKKRERETKKKLESGEKERKCLLFSRIVAHRYETCFEMLVVLPCARPISSLI